jgi:hypothetical protein
MTPLRIWIFEPQMDRIHADVRDEEAILKVQKTNRPVIHPFFHLRS